VAGGRALDQIQPAERSTAAKVLLIVLGIIFLLPGACGGVFFIGNMVDWLSNNFSFSSGEMNLGSLVLAIASISLLGSILLIGLVLRFSRWQAAPTLSLVLAVLATIVVLLTHLMGATTINSGDSEELGILFLLSALGLGVVALPPFLFWRKARLANNAGPIDQ